MATWTKKYLDVGGIELWNRELVSDGPTLLLLHGLGASGAVWQGVGRRLHPDLRLLAPDLRGHGESGKPSNGYLPRDYVGDIAALLAQDARSPVHVAGHSLGAVVGTVLAAERPELVRSLILVDPPFDASRPRGHIEDVRRLRHAPPGELERYLQGPSNGMNDIYARALADVFRQAADGPFDAALKVESGFPAAFAALRSVRAPTLVIAADPALDAALSGDAAESVVASLRHGQLLAIVGASHAVHASHPREFVAAVKNFVMG